MKEIKNKGRKAENKPSNKTSYLVNQPFTNNLFLNIESLNIIKQLLKGTDSPEWLIRAEDLVYSKLKKLKT